MDRSIELIVKKPAFSSLKPKTIKWRKLSKYEALELRKYFTNDTIETLEKKIKKQDCNLEGYYRAKGLKPIFIKILSNNNIYTQQKAEQITKWLYKNGLNVNCVIRGFPKKIIDLNLWIYAYDYIDYQFSLPTEKQLYLIGKEIGHMHRLMKQYPKKKIIQEKGVEKNKLLMKQIEKIKLNKIFLKFPEAAIQIIKKTNNNQFKSLTQNAQMVHGDMNFGNILMNKLDKKVVIIDFEDAPNSWISPLYDLAFVIQRFIISQNGADKYVLSKALIKGYKSEINLSNLIGSRSIKILINLISVRSLLILSFLPVEKQLLYLDEINKFIYLFNDTQHNKKLITHIDALITQE